MSKNILLAVDAASRDPARHVTSWLPQRLPSHYSMDDG
jgi:hypothetical protein